MRISIRKVAGPPDPKPAVFAQADGYFVRWRPNNGWRCDCPDEQCPHVDAVADLIDPSVTGEDQ